jgi:DHA1 family multidrug resistance protein-like MFS transporter
LEQRAFFIISLAIFTSMIGIGLISPLLPIYAVKLGASGFLIGIIFSGFSISRSIFIPLIGSASDRFGRKVFIALGLFIYTFASLGYVIAETGETLALVRFLQGFAAAMIVPIAMAYVGDIAKKGGEGALMGRINLFLYAGFGFGPLMGGVVARFFGFKMDFYLMGGFSFVAFLLVILLLPELGYHRKLDRDQLSYRKLLSFSSIQGVTAFRFTNSVGRGIITAFLPLLASKRAGVAEMGIGLLVAVNILLTSFFQGFFGRMGDKWSRRNLVVIGAILVSIALFLFPLARTFLTLLLVSIFFGLSSAIALPAAAAMMVEPGRIRGMGQSMSLFNLAMSLGLATGPIIGGKFVDVYGIATPFIFAASVSILGVWLFLLLVKRKG